MSRGRNKALENFSRYYTLAIEMVVAVVAPVLVGQWLDSRTGKAPWFTIIGAVLGGAAAIRSAHRTITQSLRSLERDEGSSAGDTSVRES